MVSFLDSAHTIRVWLILFAHFTLSQPFPFVYARPAPFPSLPAALFLAVISDTGAPEPKRSRTCAEPKPNNTNEFSRARPSEEEGRFVRPSPPTWRSLKDPAVVLFGVVWVPY